MTRRELRKLLCTGLDFLLGRRQYFLLTLVVWAVSKEDIGISFPLFHNRLPQTWLPKTTEIYSVTVWQPKVQNLGVRGYFSFSESTGRVLPCRFQLWWFQVSLACVYRIPIFAFTFAGLLFCLPVCLTSRLTRFRNHPDNPGWSDLEILNDIHKDPFQKIGHCHRFWGLGQGHSFLGVTNSIHYNLYWILFQAARPNTLYNFLLLFHILRCDFVMLTLLRNKRNDSWGTINSRESLRARKQKGNKPQTIP